MPSLQQTDPHQHQKADFCRRPGSSDERPGQHRDIQRAGVVQDRKTIERCNGLGTEAGNFSF